ncbi:MAG: hypothetical protein ACNA8R_10560 [Nitriliruptoraceae bacterium]
MTTPSASTPSASTPPHASPTSVPSGVPAAPPPPPEGPGAGPGGPPPGPHGPAPARSLIALIAAAAVVIVTVALVLLFGLARPPALPTLAEQPEPDLPAVAWLQWDRDNCLMVATADGALREVTCSVRGEEVLGWDDDGIALLVWERTEAIEVLDPDTGDVVGRRALPGDPWEEREGDWRRIDTRNLDGVLTVRLDGEVIWEVEAPESYWLNTGTVSPDDRFVVAVDSADRLLLLDATGAQEPRVWLEDVMSWQAAVWEGTPVPGLDG